MTTYYCWIPGYGHEPEDAEEVQCTRKALESAVGKYVERYERSRCYYPVATQGQSVTIMVAKGDRNAEPEEYIVTGELRPLYYARRVDI